MLLFSWGKCFGMLVMSAAVFGVGTMVDANTYDEHAPIEWVRSCTIGYEKDEGKIICGDYEEEIFMESEIKAALRNKIISVECYGKRTKGPLGDIYVECDKREEK